MLPRLAELNLGNVLLDSFSFIRLILTLLVLDCNKQVTKLEDCEDFQPTVF